MITGDHLNSAALKRKHILASYKEDIAFLMNDNMAVSMYNLETKKIVKANTDDDLFKFHLKAFLRMTESYDAICLHDRSFSNTRLAAGQFTRQNTFIGAFFCIRKEVHKKHMKIGRLNYYEDIDYTLQLLSSGFTTAQYVGMQFNHTNTKPTRQHSDRTKEVQDRDRDLLISYFPYAVKKRPPEKLDENLNIDIYVSYASAVKHASQKTKVGLF